MELDYQQLLKRAMERLPKKTLTSKRFLIPSVLTETQGNKTLVKNFAEILAVMRRDANHVSKFLFKELATPGAVQGNTLVLNAKVSREILQKKIENYAKEFVYCKVCGEPDTRFVKEDRFTFKVCEACGAKTSVRAV